MKESIESVKVSLLPKINCDMLQVVYKPGFLRTWESQNLSALSSILQLMTTTGFYQENKQTGMFLVPKTDPVSYEVMIKEGSKIKL